MNNDGRKRIDAIMKDIEATATAKDAINAMVEALNEAISDFKETFADIATAIEELKDEEQEKFDNMPEGLQNGERGQAIEATVSQLETAYDAAGNVAEIEDFEFDFDSDEIITALDEAKYAG